MTDYELLELAAKAAGKTNWQPNTKAWCGGCDSEGVPYWNPLRDDGDALRLAVKLKMVLDTDYNGGSIAGNATISWDYDDPEYGYQEGAGKKEPYAATRRAIVRAAAEIGRRMK